MDMAQRLLGLVMALVMACPTLSFAQEDVLAAVRKEPRGVRVLLVMKNGTALRGSLVSVDDKVLIVGRLDPYSKGLTLRNAPGRPGAFIFGVDELSLVEAQWSARPVYIAVDNEPPNPDLVRATVNRLEMGSTIDIRTTRQVSYRAKLLGVRADGFDIAARRRVVSLAYSEVAAVGPAGMSGLKKGLLTGFGLYAAIAAAVFVIVMRET